MVYDFARIPAKEKDAVVKRLAILNLDRNRCIEAIDEHFRAMLITVKGKKVRSLCI